MKSPAGQIQSFRPTSGRRGCMHDPIKCWDFDEDFERSTDEEEACKNGRGKT